jgi:hypothetical protein
MKTTLKFFLTLVISLSAFLSVQAQERVATFFAQDGERFWVILDGIKQNEKPSANVKVTGLTNPNYRVKVIFEDETLNNIDQSIMTEGFVDESMESKPADVTWMLRKDKKGKMVMRGSTFKVAGSTKSPEPRQETVKFHTEPLPEPAPVTTTQTTTTQTTTKQNPVPPGQQQLNVQITTDGLNTNMQVTAPDTDSDMQAIPATDMTMDVKVNGQTTGTTTVKTTTTTTTTTRQTSTTEQPAPQQNPAPVAEKKTQACVNAMSAANFENAKSSIAKQSFSETRMNIAKQAIRGCVSTAQMLELLPLFSFEGDKLAFAKFGYDFTVDKSNYYTLSDLFSFSSSVDELTEFLNGK